MGKPSNHYLEHLPIRTQWVWLGCGVVIVGWQGREGLRGYLTLFPLMGGSCLPRQAASFRALAPSSCHGVGFLPTSPGRLIPDSGA